MDDRDPPVTPAPPFVVRRPASPRRIEAQSLFGDAVEVEIVHEDEVYRLRRTRNGRLLLNK